LTIPHRVLVCGGRDYSDWKTIYNVLDKEHAENPIDVLIHGGAKGADRIAHVWASKRNVKVEYYKITEADWSLHGNAAGPIRNQEMLDKGKPDLVIAFPSKNSVGTYDMIDRAGIVGVPVRKI
jgi:hypothetical protein